MKEFVLQWGNRMAVGARLFLLLWGLGTLILNSPAAADENPGQGEKKPARIRFVVCPDPDKPGECKLKFNNAPKDAGDVENFTWGPDGPLEGHFSFKYGGKQLNCTYKVKGCKMPCEFEYIRCGDPEIEKRFKTNANSSQPPEQEFR
jgi:hypothetical protein